MRASLAVSMVVALAAAVMAQADRPAVPVRLADVLPLWDTLRPHLPRELEGVAPGALEAAWHTWLQASDRSIRARVAGGEEDSLVNFWLFGTSFTASPPVRERDIGAAQGGDVLVQVAQDRLDDLLDGAAAPGSNTRLQWARRFLGARGIDPAARGGRERARALLLSAGRRIVAENAAYARVLVQPNTNTDPLAWMRPYASLYSDRGLSVDTSILSSFAIDTALDALGASGRIPAGSIRRVAVVGPGLDVMNKADGHDAYPEQSIQPFTVLDSLMRHRLSAAGVSLTTFDVSPRVNDHFQAARERARAGEPYALHLPLGETDRWSDALVGYWERAGDRIASAAAAPPRSTPGLKLKAMRVRPDVVSSIVPRDLNIVVERIPDLPADERFDLVIATNVFVYYDTFAQTLALLNVASMLRPGGSLLSNQALIPVPPLKAEVGHEKVTHSDRQFDHVFWYQRR